MTRRRIVFLSVLAIVVALGAAAWLVPLSAFREPLEAAASRALGRQVQIRGSLHLAVYPQLGISLKDVSIANAAGGKEPQMITVGKIVVGAELMPLLSGRLRVTKVVLKEPVIHLEIGADGTTNWQSPSAGTPASPSEAASVSMQRVKIEDGTVTYFDARNGKTDTLRAVSLSLTTADTDTADRQLALDGTMTYGSIPVKLAAKLDDLDAFLKGGPGKTDVSASSELFNLGFAGRVQAPDSATGNLTLKTRSLRTLAAWIGKKLPPGNGLGAATIDSAVSAKDGVVTLSKAAISLDGMTINGDLSLDAKQDSPALRGSLAIDHLNAISYLATGASKDVTAASADSSPDTPLVFDGLKGVDADLSLTIGTLKLPAIKLDKMALSAALHGGMLKANISNLAVYGGAGKGTATIDATGAVPAFHNVVDISGVKTELLFAQMPGAPQIATSGTAHLDLASRGVSETDIIKNLSGKLSVSFGAGAISGVDLGAVAQLLQSTANLLNGAIGGGSKTEFSSLSASFTLQNGVARTGDFRLTAPTMTMTGAGTVNLATHQIDFRFEPTARVGVAGVHLADIGVSFYARGSWNNPTFEADPASLAKGVVGAVGGTATQILGVPGSALKSLFGGN